MAGTTKHGESAVLVLAAGAGTRMRSDVPKVLHTLAGRSMLAHSLHAITKMAPQHLVVVLGHDRQRIEQSIGELTGPSGARSTWRCRTNSSAPATRCCAA